MLLEVAHVLTRQEILTGQFRMPRDDGNSEQAMIPMYLSLLANGMQSGDMVDGSVVLGRTQYFWNDPTADPVRQTVRVLPVARGLELSAGNVVEAQQGYTFAMVIGVKYRTLAEGKCFYGTDDGAVSGMARTAIRPVGRDGAASLRCVNLASEGWTQVRRCNGIEWTKPPQAGRTWAAFYGESRALDQLNRAFLAPFLSCYASSP